GRTRREASAARGRGATPSGASRAPGCALLGSGPDPSSRPSRSPAPPEVPMRLHRIFGIVAILAACATAASAAVKSRVVEYSYNDQPLQGYLAWDDAAKAKRPGVIVVHEW